MTAPVGDGRLPTTDLDAAPTAEPAAYDVICLSHEPWDEVWRRNQLFATELLAMRPGLRLLFVERATDVIWSLSHRRRPDFRPLRPVGDSGRLWAITPRKWLPRRIRPGTDEALGRQVLSAARRLAFRDPVLWVNDSTYACLVRSTGWSSIYDVTDDWLLADDSPASLERQCRNDAELLGRAAEVVVCSPNLAKSRGQTRDVHVIPNGVDLEHFRRTHPRPADLPSGPIVLYTGTLAEGRLDIELCLATSRAVATQASLVLLGPNVLSPQSSGRLQRAGAILLGARPYDHIPAYMQHAAVLVVPHLVNPFTESLDPIKAREILAVGRPAVSTPVAGFRELAPAVTLATRDRFPAAVMQILGGEPLPPGPGPLRAAPASWSDRAASFLRVLDSAAARRAPNRGVAPEARGDAEGPRG